MFTSDSSYCYFLRIVLLDELKAVDSNLCYLNDNKLTEILLYGSFLFNSNQNRSILYSPRTYIMDSK